MTAESLATLALYFSLFAMLIAVLVAFLCLRSS